MGPIRHPVKKKKGIRPAGDKKEGKQAKAGVTGELKGATTPLGEELNGKGIKNGTGGPPGGTGKKSGHLRKEHGAAKP